MGGHPEDRLAFRLLHPGDTPADASETTELASEANDPWVVQTAVKFLLSHDQISRALAIPVAWMQRGGNDTRPLNLIARFAASRGHREIAQRVCGLSLKKAPHQRDMVLFQEHLESGNGDNPTPCLNILPPDGRVVYYLPCYNVAEHIARTIEAVASQCHPIEELLVIDDGSPDDSITIASQYPVRVIRHDRNRGLAAARNTAWQHTEAEFIATVDTDATPEPGYLKNALMSFEQGPPEVAMTGGRLVEVHTVSPADAWRARYLGQDPGPIRWYVDGPEAASSSPARCAWNVEDGLPFLTGSDTVARRSALEAVGGYEERFRTNAEDLTLCKALLNHGYHYEFVPACVAHHHRRDTLETVLRTAWNYGFWHRKDCGCYRNATAIVGLLDDHTVASQHFIMEAITSKQFSVLYIEFLYPFYSALLDWRHGVESGVLTAGQAKTLELSTARIVSQLDEQFGGRLLEKVRESTANLRFDETITGTPLDEKAAAKLDEVLNHMMREYGAYNQALYDLIAAP